MRRIPLIFACVIVAIASTAFGVFANRSKAVILTPQSYRLTQITYNEAGDALSVTERFGGTDGKLRETTHHLLGGKTINRIIVDGAMYVNRGEPAPVSNKLSEKMLSSSFWESHSNFVRRDSILGVPVWVLKDPNDGAELWINPAYGIQPLKSIYESTTGKMVTETVRISIGPQPDTKFVVEHSK